MAKGGMCKNPFAGNDSLNGLDDFFMESLFKGKVTVDQAITLRVIKMSVRDYLYFGLGKNGITAEKFLEAYQYLWSTVPASSDIFHKTFENHFTLSNLCQHMDIHRFRRLLRTKREKILGDNSKQVLAYVEQHKSEEWRTVRRNRGSKYAFPVNKAPLQTLAAPSDPVALAKLLLFGRKNKVQKRTKKRLRPSRTPQYLSTLFSEV